MATIFDQNVLEEDFSVTLQRYFATYGLSVVTDRALPDARDGLKPVQRRILYGMWVARYLSSRTTVKSAEVVGKILGDYHPHGDTSVYDAMVRMAQDFTMRYPLIDGQGNWGSVEGDAAAAYRYTECRLSPLAEAIMADIERETVSLHPTYKQDPKVQEPDYLPGRIPPLVNPSSGIAVGLSTNIPPHNLGEVMRACIALLDEVPTKRLTTEQLMDFVPGPDFSTGGVIVGGDGIKDYLETGKGRMVVRSVVKLEETPRSRALVVTQIPPIGKDKVRASIVKAVNERKLEGLVPEVRDESDTEKGLRIVLELKKESDPAETLTALFKETDLQIAVSAQMVFLFGEPMQQARQPKQVGIAEVLRYWNTHQLDVLTRRLQHDLTAAKNRLHIVQGLIVGAANAKQIVAIFQDSADRAEAKTKIMAKYKLSEIQAGVIADMTLSQVTRLDAGKYQTESAELTGKIAELEDLLATPAKRVAMLKREMQDLIKRFGDPRRTVIDADARADAKIESVANMQDDGTPVVLALGRDNTIKRLAADAFTPVGKRKLTVGKPDAPVRHIVPATSHSYILCVSDQGRVFQIGVNKLDEISRADKGIGFGDLLQLEFGEEIIGIAPIANFNDDLYLMQFTALGKVKKSAISEYRQAAQEGLPDMRLADGDTVIAAFVCGAEGDLMVTASNGTALRFANADVRAQGRIGQGMAAVNVPDGVHVVAASYVAPGAEAKANLIIFTAAGLAKRLALSECPRKGRASAPLAMLKTTGATVTAIVAPANGQIIVSGHKNTATLISIATLPQQGRADAPQISVTLAAGEKLVGACLLP